MWTLCCFAQTGILVSFKLLTLFGSQIKKYYGCSVDTRFTHNHTQIHCENIIQPDLTFSRA